jgi:hypothetical protein
MKDMRTQVLARKKRLSLSLTKNCQRKQDMFKVCSTEELNLASKKQVPKHTVTSLSWAYQAFEQWIKQSSTISGRTYKIEDLWANEDPVQLCEMLSCFCLEVKQKNGDSYTPKSVLQLLINLQKYALDQNDEAFHFMNQKDQRFKRIHTVLDNLSKKLHKDGIGASKVQARVVTIAEEDKMWTNGAMGTETPEALLNAVFFYCGIYLCLRGGEEHRALKYSQFKVEEVQDPHNASETIKRLTYTEHGSKNKTAWVSTMYIRCI